MYARIESGKIAMSAKPRYAVKSGLFKSGVALVSGLVAAVIPALVQPPPAEARLLVSNLNITVTDSRDCDGRLPQQ